MEHPLISNIDHLTVEELQQRITELNKKIHVASRSGNASLVAQIRMALETFNNKYQQRLREEWESKNKGGNDYSDRIDIS